MMNTVLKNTPVMKRFSDVARIVTGKTPATSNRLFFGGHIPFVTPGDLDGGSPIVVTKTQLTEEGAGEVNQLPEGSVLVSCIGSLGKIGIAGVNVCTNQQINALVFDTTLVEPRYGYHFCKTLKPYLEGIAPATTLPIINKSRFSEIEMPLPPLTEQRRIASILDKADALRTKRRETIVKLDQLLQSVFLEMFGDPVTNPKGWPETDFLGDVADICSGITKGRRTTEKTRDIPYLAVANVQDRHLKLDSVKTICATDVEIERYRLAVNDLLLTEGGDPDKLGRGALWDGSIAECIHQNHIFRVRITSKTINPVFLNRLVGSARGKRYFLSVSKQTTGIASINMKQLKKFPLLTPPLELQMCFAAAVSKIEAHQRKLEKAEAYAEQLFQSLQQQSFTEKL